MGQEIWKKEGIENESVFNIDLKTIPKGTYYMKIQKHSDDYSFCELLIKQ
jgi:hypothetical protein